MASYAYFLVHSVRALADDGQPVTVPVGYGTLSRSADSGGHADIRLSASETARHYDNTCTAVFEMTVGEDDHGIWFAGRLMPGLDELTEHRARGTTFSGDWRMIRGNLELVAALGVNTPGFPVPHARVASGAPVALVAAGVVPPETAPESPQGDLAALGVLPGELGEIVAWVKDQRLQAAKAGIVADLQDMLATLGTLSGVDVEQATLELEADLLLILDGDHPWFTADDDYALTAAGKKKLHLPPYIKRIAKHLQQGGMEKGRAIASAVNAAKKMCKTGDLNFPGLQKVNAGSKAEACAAVAQWVKDRPGAVA
jgi:hypothetical protein